MATNAVEAAAPRTIKSDKRQQTIAPTHPQRSLNAAYDRSLQLRRRLPNIDLCPAATPISESKRAGWPEVFRQGVETEKAPEQKRKQHQHQHQQRAR